jgi:hypothetical protein
MLLSYTKKKDLRCLSTLITGYLLLGTWTESLPEGPRLLQPEVQAVRTAFEEGESSSQRGGLR